MLDGTSDCKTDIEAKEKVCLSVESSPSNRGNRCTKSNSVQKSFQKTRNIIRKRRKIKGSGGGRGRNGAAAGSLPDAADDCPGARKAASAATSVIAWGEGETAAAKVAAAVPEKILIGEARQVGEIELLLEKSFHTPEMPMITEQILRLRGSTQVKPARMTRP